MYGKIFEEIFGSTLATSLGFVGIYTFSSMVILADKDDCVRLDDRSLWRRLQLDVVNGPCKVKVPFSQFEILLKRLQEPDPNSNIQVREGRRIIALADMPELDGNRGYWVVNRKAYKLKASREEKLEADRLRIAGKRKLEKDNQNEYVADSRESSHQVANVAYTETETEKKNNIPPLIPPVGGNPQKPSRRSRKKPEQDMPADFELSPAMREYALSKGMADPEHEFEAFCEKHRAKGSRFADWAAAWRTWVLNHKKWAKPQTQTPAKDDWLKGVD